MISTKVKDYFKDKFVGVVTKSIKGSQQSTEGVFSGNHVIEGVYADEDKYFLFLANESGVVVDAIHKKDIVRIFLVLEDVLENELN